MRRSSPNALPTLDGDSFRAIADLAYQESGLTLVIEKSTMIQSRLRHRLRALGLEEFSQYSTYLKSRQGNQEKRQFISALTTNVSHFFREAHHFDLLHKMLINRYASQSGKRSVRIWSAGCSKGQEPLSIGMSVLERLPQLTETDFRILATDIDPAVIRFAQQGAYPERMTKGTSAAMKKKYFKRSVIDSGDIVHTATRAVRELIRFNELNLLAPWPMRTPFDAIFCRNVVIYFDLPTQATLWPRFRQAMRPDGILFLGHSERIADPEKFGFECIAPTAYRRISD